MKTNTSTFSLISAVMLTWVLSAFSALAADWVAPTQIPASQAERLQKIQTLTSAIASDKLSTEDKASEERMLLLIRYNTLLESNDASLAQLNALIADTKKYVKAHKKDYEIAAMLGSAQSYSSVFYKDNVGKMNYYAKMGIRMLDRSKRKAPNNLGVLLQRGITYSVMPAFLNKAKFALEDLQVVKNYFADKENPQMQNMVNFYLATAQYHNEEKESALALWKTIAESGVAPWDMRAKAELKDKD